MANNDQAQQDLAAALASIATAVTGMTQQQQAIAQQLQQLQQQQPAGNTAFHTSPAGRDINAIIDMGSRSGKSIYDESKADRTRVV